MDPSPFKPALIVVDLQEDFCPPNGSLAVTNGREVIPIINKLLDLPFALKIATKDWHPTDHISFASNHPNKKPYEDFTTITHPSDPTRAYESRLWPVHCVQHTPGAALVAELDVSKIDRVVEKGQKREVEMYSAFYDPLGVADSGLKEVLKKEGVTDVFVVGLAADYCVQATARDAKKEGFRVCIVEEGTRAVSEEGWEGMQVDLYKVGVEVVGVDGEEVGQVRAL